MGNGGRPGLSAGTLFISAARCQKYFSSGLSLLLQLGSIRNGSGPLEGWAIEWQDKNLTEKTLKLVDLNNIVQASDYVQLHLDLTLQGNCTSGGDFHSF